jgi:hypothetical protein
VRDNPAERLHDLLSAFKGVANQPMLSAWAAVLGVERDNLPELLHAVAAVTALPAQLEADLRAALPPDNDLELFLAWKPKVEAAMQGFANSGTTADGVQRQYDDSTLVSLQHASHALRTSGRELQDDQLTTLADALQGLDELISGSADIDTELQVFLLDLVYEMKRAVRLVRVQGVDGLQVALERSVGALHVRAGLGQPLPDPDSHVGRRFFAVIAQLGGLIAFGNSSFALGGNVLDVLRAIGS